MATLQTCLLMLVAIICVQYQVNGDCKNTMTMQDCLSLVSQLSLGLHKMSCTKSMTKVLADCKALYNNGIRRSGVYKIKPGNKAFHVYCDMSHGGGWTVIQRRVSNKVNFYRGWHDYVKGFGNLKGNFWLGLEKIHQLTAKASRLRVDMWKKGKYGYAEYKQFRVEGGRHKYRLHVSGYSGTAGDSLSNHNSMYFSTKDRDNDRVSSSCAQTYQGAWWYGSCHSSNLNGRYFGGPHKSYANGVNWYSFAGYHYSLIKAEMKVRRA